MKNTLIASAIVAAVVALVVGFVLPRQTAQTVQNLGSLVGPDIPSPYLRWGGVAVYNAAASLKQGSTTPCALQSPNATSTLEAGGINFTVASSTAITVVAAQSATAFATTTLINSKSITGQGMLIAASTTLSSLEQTNRIFAPNTWLVFSETGGITAGDAGTGFVPKGRCQAVWVAYPTL